MINRDWNSNIPMKMKRKIIIYYETGRTKNVIDTSNDILGRVNNSKLGYGSERKVQERN